jgi:predicted nucleotidyltransferase
VFFGVPGLTTYDDFASRAFQVNIDGQMVNTVSRRDLITLKRATGRPEDTGAADELEELERLEANEPA